MSEKFEVWQNEGAFFYDLYIDVEGKEKHTYRYTNAPLSVMKRFVESIRKKEHLKSIEADFLIHWILNRKDESEVKP